MLCGLLNLCFLIYPPFPNTLPLLYDWAMSFASFMLLLLSSSNSLVFRSLVKYLVTLFFLIFFFFLLMSGGLNNCFSHPFSFYIFFFPFLLFLFYHSRVAWDYIKASTWSLRGQGPLFKQVANCLPSFCETL